MDCAHFYGCRPLSQLQITERQLAGHIISSSSEAQAAVQDLLARNVLSAHTDGSLQHTNQGHTLFLKIKAAVDRITTALYDDMPQADLEATHRTLSEIASRASKLLSAQTRLQPSSTNFNAPVQHISKSSSRRIPVAPEFTIYEYGSLGKNTANGSVAEVKGRYPAHGWGRNNVCDEIVYVISGTGYLEMPDGHIALSAGDVAFVPKETKIAWNGQDLVLFLPCVPAWNPAQHELLDS